MEKEIKDKFSKLEKRIDMLEKIILKNKIKNETKISKKHGGPTGGIQLLIDDGFFNKPVLVTEVNAELQREGYFYTIQSVDTIMRRDFVKRKRILNRVQIDGIWQYVLRK